MRFFFKLYNGATEDSVFVGYETVLYEVIGCRFLEGKRYIHLQASIIFHLMNTADEVDSFETS
jgi:hypothetical protein